MTHVISLLVENHQGVLSRISGLFSGRGYNLESFTAGPTTDESMTRITLVCNGDDAVIDQIKKQLNKIIDTIKVVDLTERETKDRELALIKIGVKPGKRDEIVLLTEAFKGKVLDIGQDAMIIEITGSAQKINDFLLLLEEYPILEMARSGLVSMEKCRKTRTAGMER